jgi:hypothetical protein
MLDDAPFGGIGAGGFADLSPIYREIADPPSPPTAATAASTFAIEFGKPMFWLLSAATQRHNGRKHFIGGVAVSFVDTGLFGTATGVILSATLGLGVAQSKSRTTGS